MAKSLGSRVEQLERGADELDEAWLAEVERFGSWLMARATEDEIDKMAEIPIESVETAEGWGELGGIIEGIVARAAARGVELGQLSFQRVAGSFWPTEDGQMEVSDGKY